ncbi:hypothetical protein M878_04925 [Streptomyces roseochromogenus subsp. oscitans DS 12.976]|uniref:Uncharacterized protein n=1 Tax=Streptomyces roseochromogenus subsp. oscitans DS 12.976 TaxID=1352936 RepID=V6KU79_STRRC|nr:hypothetical protein M878_04925 [Streptomyces roseochromogenus subsp. oscitans DS 12.976]
MTLREGHDQAGDPAGGRPNGEELLRCRRAERARKSRDEAGAV